MGTRKIEREQVSRKEERRKLKTRLIGNSDKDEVGHNDSMHAQRLTFIAFGFSHHDSVI